MRSRASSAALQMTIPPELVPTRTMSERSSKKSSRSISRACVVTVMPARTRSCRSPQPSSVGAYTACPAFCRRWATGFQIQPPWYAP